MGGGVIHWMEKEGKRGQVGDGGWITSSDFYGMNLISSHCGGFAFPFNEAANLWRTLPHRTEALSLSPSNGTAAWTWDLTPPGSLRLPDLPTGLLLAHWWLPHH